MKKTISAMVMVGLMLMAGLSALSVSAVTQSSNSQYKPQYITLDIDNDPVYKNAKVPDNPESGEEETIINAAAGGNCALIIREDGTVNLLFCMMRTAGHAKDTASSAGYNVKYLKGPLKIQLENAITNWIPQHLGGEKKVFIYLMAHGASELGGIVALRPWLMMSAYWFANQINKIKDCYSKCIIVLDTCYGGSFIDDLSSNNRIVITSTDDRYPAYVNPAGEALFSGAFLTALDNPDNSIGAAWEIADSTILGGYQNPQLEDNGNEYAVGKYDHADTLPINDGYTPETGIWDGVLALHTYLTGGSSGHVVIPIPCPTSSSPISSSSQPSTTQQSVSSATSPTSTPATTTTATASTTATSKSLISLL